MKSSTVLRILRHQITRRTVEADSVLHSRPAKPLFRFRYADVLLMKAEAMERNDGDGRAEYKMVRAHAGLPARKSSLANILEDRCV